MGWFVKFIKKIGRLFVKPPVSKDVAELKDQIPDDVELVAEKQVTKPKIDKSQVIVPSDPGVIMELVRNMPGRTKLLAMRGPREMNTFMVQMFAGLRDAWEDEVWEDLGRDRGADDDVPLESFYIKCPAASRCKQWHSELEKWTQFEFACLIAYNEKRQKSETGWQESVLQLTLNGETPDQDRVLFYLGGIPRGKELLERAERLKNDGLLGK
jgi:hypothetical protein